MVRERFGGRKVAQPKPIPRNQPLSAPRGHPACGSRAWDALAPQGWNHPETDSAVAMSATLGSARISSKGSKTCTRALARATRSASPSRWSSAGRTFARTPWQPSERVALSTGSAWRRTESQAPAKNFPTCRRASLKGPSRSVRRRSCATTSSGSIIMKPASATASGSGTSRQPCRASPATSMPSLKEMWTRPAPAGRCAHFSTRVSSIASSRSTIIETSVAMRASTLEASVCSSSPIAARISVDFSTDPPEYGDPLSSVSTTRLGLEGAFTQCLHAGHGNSCCRLPVPGTALVKELAKEQGIPSSLRAPVSEARGMVPPPERRRASRISTAIDARLTGPDGAQLAAQLENLSVVGLRARVERDLAPGTRCSVELRAYGVSIEARGRVLRSEDEVLALRFEALPYESYERLRSFLLAHADDPAVIADELSDRLGFLGES